MQLDNLSSNTLHQLAESLIPAVYQAGEAIMSYYQHHIVVETKADGTPATAADVAAEAILLRAVHQHTPNIPVIAEEATAKGGISAFSGNMFFLIDPLDGTREFINKTDEFTVNIALIINNKPVLGLVYAPALDIFCLAAAQQLWQVTSGKLQPVICHNSTPPYHFLTSRSHRDRDKIDTYIAAHPQSTLAATGSSLKFCYLALGKGDIYLRLGKTMEWDTAAGQAVLEAAGGHVITTTGAPLAYHKHESGYENSGFLAVAKGVDSSAPALQALMHYP